jgi:AraC-like DNA-binding protein
LIVLELEGSQFAGGSALSEVFPGLHMVLGDRLENAVLRSSTLGRGRVFRVGNLADRVERRVDSRDETSGFFKLLLQVRGESMVVVDGKRAVLCPGDSTLLDGAANFSIELGRDYEQLLFQLPRDVVTRRHEPLLGLVGRALRGQEPGHALVFDAVSAIARHLDALSEAGRAQTLDSIVALLGALAPERADVSASERHLARALIDLEAHLSDPDLSAEVLASWQGLSRRRLDAVFAEQGQSVERRIWDRRLERIATDLQDPSKRALRLIDVALSWGFNSEAHFSRAFRSKFGEAPSVYRRRFNGATRAR